MPSLHCVLFHPSVWLPWLVGLSISFVGIGCTSGESNTLPTSAIDNPPAVDPGTDPGSSDLVILHGVPFDPLTSANFAGTPLSGLVSSTVMVTVIGATEFTAPFAIEQVTVDIDDRPLPCWYFGPEGLLAKDASGAIRVIGHRSNITAGEEENVEYEVVDYVPNILLPAPPLEAGTTFVPYASQSADTTVISVNQTAPTGATGCLLLRHSSPGVVGVVVSTQNRDRWILPGAAMPFQANYLLSLDRTFIYGIYRLSHPGG